MKNPWITTCWMFVVLGVCSGAVPVLGAQQDADAGKKAMQQRFKQRIAALQKYKDAGKVGETWLGYVAALEEKYLEDKKLKQLIADENRDRQALYALLAREQSTPKVTVTVRQVGKQNAKLKFKKAAGGEYFKAKDGKWRTKTQMLEEMKKKRAQEKTAETR